MIILKMSNNKRGRVDIDLCSDDDSEPDVRCSMCCEGCTLQYRCMFCADVLCESCSEKSAVTIVHGKLHCRWCVQHLAVEYAKAEERFLRMEAN